MLRYLPATHLGIKEDILDNQLSAIFKDIPVFMLKCVAGVTRQILKKLKNRDK